MQLLKVQVRLGIKFKIGKTHDSHEVYWLGHHYTNLTFSSSSNCILLSSFCLKDSKTLLGCPSTNVTLFANREASCCRIFSACGYGEGMHVQPMFNRI